MSTAKIQEDYERQLEELEREEGLNPQTLEVSSPNINKAFEKAEKTKKPKKEKKEPAKAAAPDKKSPMDFIQGFVTANKGSNTMAADESYAFIDLGHAGLNYLGSGRFFGPLAGAPRGKLWETFGPSGSLKSAKGYIAGGNVQRAGGIFAVVDAEGARNTLFMKLCGVDVEACVNLVPHDADGDECYSIAHCFSIVRHFVASLRKAGFDGPIYVLIDSIATAPSLDEWMQLKAGKEVKEDQGRRAKTINQFQRCINGFLRSGDNTLEIINQIRAVMPKPGQFFGPTETTTSGKSTEYYSDFRIDIRKKKAIQRNTFDKKEKTEGESEGAYAGRLRKLGFLFGVTSEKSRQTAPHRHIPSLEFYFEHGIAPMSGLFEMLVTDEWIIPKLNEKGTKTGVYAWADPRSRLSANVIPLDGIPTFKQKDFDEGGWILDQAHLFGTNRETIELFMSARRQEIDGVLRDPHNFSLSIKKLMAEKPEEYQATDESDAAGDESPFDRKNKVEAMATKSGGNYMRAATEAQVLEDETPGAAGPK